MPPVPPEVPPVLRRLREAIASVEMDPSTFSDDIVVTTDDSILQTLEAV